MIYYVRLIVFLIGYLNDFWVLYSNNKIFVILMKKNVRNIVLVLERIFDVLDFIDDYCKFDEK